VNGPQRVLPAGNLVSDDILGGGIDTDRIRRMAALGVCVSDAMAGVSVPFDRVPRNRTHRRYRHIEDMSNEKVWDNDKRPVEQ
jgi:hypothetical protein